MFENIGGGELLVIMFVVFLFFGPKKMPEIGKNIGSDLKKGKRTFPSFFGLEGSRLRAKEVGDKAIDALRDFDHRADPLRELAKYIVNRVN